MSFFKVFLLFTVFISTPVFATQNFSLSDVNGKEHKLSNEKGKWVIINYWATWCPPCVREIPELVKFHKLHKDKDAIVWGVNFENIEEKEVQSFLKDFSVNYPILLAEPGSYSYFSPVQALPITYFISPEGKLVHTKIGTVSIPFIESIMQKHGNKK